MMEFAGTRWMTWKGLPGPLTLHDGTVVFVNPGDAVEAWETPTRRFYLNHRPALQRFHPFKKRRPEKAGEE